MIAGPNLDRLLFSEECSACGARRPLFDLNVSKLVDYALVYRVCRYCATRLSDASRRHAILPDRIPFFVINAHGEETHRARGAALRQPAAPLPVAGGER